MKYLRTDLDRKCSATSDSSKAVVVDFFYSDRGGTIQRGHEWMLRSLLYQILNEVRDLWECYQVEFEDFKRCHDDQWQLRALVKIFTVIKAHCKLHLTIYVLIDAMDGSDVSRREEIMKQLSDVYDSE
jgi:hypothetical protein